MSNWKTQLSTAQNFAHFGQNDQCITICNDLLKVYFADKEFILKVSSLFLGYGFLSNVRDCLSNGLELFPADTDLLLVLANTQLQLGQTAQCRAIYKELLDRSPDNTEVLRNLIFVSEYLPISNNNERLELAKKWGQLSIEKAGGPHSRPPFKKISPKKIKLGYISADFCQHTVGILIKNILAKHNTDQFEVFCYSSGSVDDVMTDFIREHSQFVKVTNLSDFELASRIQSDDIDILIDLSGHTGGSRLSVFSYRPAPLQVSWLGYYSTTGLESTDAVLLDRWHIHDQIDSQFIEPIACLPIGRWCYFPAIDPAPLITEPPTIENGYITFGSFNNTLKYNEQVYAVWAKILQAVPNSKILLKWQTFYDSEFRQHVLAQFHSLGIDPSRIELRGPSFHIDMLVQYKDIDIALDPFPFSGGVTSCEALYMGVPVITWPQDRVVSRQTYAFLSSIGRPELAAQNEAEYVQKAVDLANSPEQLIEYRQALRELMLTSPLMQSTQFTKSLESTLIELLRQTQQSGS